METFPVKFLLVWSGDTEESPRRWTMKDFQVPENLRSRESLRLWGIEHVDSNPSEYEGLINIGPLQWHDGVHYRNGTTFLDESGEWCDTFD